MRNNSSDSRELTRFEEPKRKKERNTVEKKEFYSQRTEAIIETAKSYYFCSVLKLITKRRDLWSNYPNHVIIIWEILLISWVRHSNMVPRKIGEQNNKGQS